MSDGYAVNAFEADLRQIIDAQVEPNWPLVRIAGEIAVIAVLARNGDQRDRFVLRLKWQRYPDDPPSLKFLDPVTGRDDIPTAWPTGGPFRPQSLDVCVNYCAEGFQLHPEWRQDAQARWATDGNALLRALHNTQHDLDTKVTGRFNG
jgi:hypothetical protein